MEFALRFGIGGMEAPEDFLDISRLETGRSGHEFGVSSRGKG
jgi:hypothetical protein